MRFRASAKVNAWILHDALSMENHFTLQFDNLSFCNATERSPIAFRSVLIQFGKH
jgi:hypothetical protein